MSTASITAVSMTGASTATPVSTAATAATSNRLGLMLSDLRLTTIKRLTGDLCAQSDSQGWPGHRLLELINRIAQLVPPPRTHRHRYYGVLAPNLPLRAVVTAMVQVAVPVVELSSV